MISTYKMNITYNAIGNTALSTGGEWNVTCTK